VEYDGRLYPFEIKATSTPTPSHAAALKKWSDLARDVGEPAIIIADISAPATLQSGVRAVLWWWL
jgi:hypothetical protein